MTVSDLAWWQRGVLYHVYPRSFQDSNGDGVGDLRGVHARVDYLEGLGVDAVWLSPIFPSPMADLGYDVADYCDVDPDFGSMADLEALRDELHRRDMKLVLDLVPNHTSERHPWFEEARSGREHPRRHWYLWAEPAPGGGPPNNWLSVFGGSAWEFDRRTGQYYYHAFLKEQPDLNWRHPEVREAIYDVMRFWLERGIDGFRVDAMWHLIKDDRLRDNPVNPDHDRARELSYHELLPVFTTDRPEVYEIVEEMREVVEEYDHRLLIGEIYMPIERLVRYYGTAGRGAHLPFNFQLIALPWDARRIEAVVDEYEAALPPGAWPNWVLGNHDKPRVASRFGAAEARAAAVLLLTLRGTPTLYYGDELGLENGDIPPEGSRDPIPGRDPGSRSRDPYRSPMPWSHGPGAGFTTGEPWLPLPADHECRNVEAQRRAPSSALELHRKLLALRRASPALQAGSYAPIPCGEELFAFVREHRGERVLVVINFAGEAASFRPRFPIRGEVLLSTHERRGPFASGDALTAREAVVAAVTEGGGSDP